MPPSDWRTADFDYSLPADLIAAHPPARRDAARMLVIDRQSGTIGHRRFVDFRELVRPGDEVVLNDTRVVKARFISDDGRIELLRLGVGADGRWRCLVKPGRRMRRGDRVWVGGCAGTVTAIDVEGTRLIEWEIAPDEARFGHLALPHYMGRGDEAGDEERYQTTFAHPDHGGAIAAPTAGLHFTPELLAALPHSFVTLHVGVGTFRPVRVEKIADHVMHGESYEVTAATAARIEAAARVIAVGTTVARVLEHLARTRGAVTAGRGETDIFIHPPFSFLRVGALLTNFHLPKSTLLMLVSAFAGRDLVLDAYREAIRERYRFFSYGDCMLIV